MVFDVELNIETDGLAITSLRFPEEMNLSESYEVWNSS